MMAGTSPSITETQTESYVVAFQANTGSLWSVGLNQSAHSYGLGMMAGTSPSLAS